MAREMDVKWEEERKKDRELLQGKIKFKKKNEVGRVRNKKVC